MKGLITFCAAAVLILVAGSAQAEMYDFNAIAPGNYDAVTFSNLFQGISFNSTVGNNFQVQPVSLGPDFSGKAVINLTELSSPPSNSTVATFDVLSTFFSVTMGDYNYDIDELFLYAYDAGNNVVDSDFHYNPASSYAGHTLSVAGNIAWVKYGVEGDYNTFYWDNVAFTPIPIPAAVLLGMLGLGVAGMKLRKSS